MHHHPDSAHRGFSEFCVPSTRPGCPSLETTCKWEYGTFQDTTTSFNTILTLSGERLVYNMYLAVSVVAYIAAQPPGLQAGQLLQGGGLSLAGEARPRVSQHPMEQA